MCADAGGFRAVFFLADSCAQWTMGKYLPPITMGLTAAIVECVLYVPFSFLDALKVKSDEENRG